MFCISSCSLCFFHTNVLWFQKTPNPTPIPPIPAPTPFPTQTIATVKDTALETEMPTPMPTPVPPTTTKSNSTAVATSSTAQVTTDTATELSLFVGNATASTNIRDMALIGGVAAGAIAVLSLVGVAVAVGMRRRCNRAPTEVPTAGASSPRLSGPANAIAIEQSCRTSAYGPIVTDEFASARMESPYATTAAAITSSDSHYGAFTQNEIA